MSAQSNRRAVLAILAGLGLMLILTACGDPTALSVSTQPPTTQTARSEQDEALLACRYNPASCRQTTANAAAGSTTVILPSATRIIPSPTSQPPTATPIPPATTVIPDTTAAIAPLQSLLSASQFIELDPTIISEFRKQGQVQGWDSPLLKLYTSKEEKEPLINRAHALMIEAGYHFGVPGSKTNLPTKVGFTMVGLYSKAGVPDVLLASRIATDAQELLQRFNVPNISPAVSQKLAQQLKGRTSAFFILVAPNLLQTLLKFATAGQPVTASPVATTTLTVALPGEQTIPVYSGAKLAKAVSGTSAGIVSTYYLSSEQYEKITTWAKSAFTAKGWNDVQVVEAAGTAVITGRQGDYNLFGTIVGPKGQANTSFENIVQLVKASPTETIIAVTIVPNIARRK